MLVLFFWVVGCVGVDGGFRVLSSVFIHLIATCTNYWCILYKSAMAYYEGLSQI